jgi:hypothetical protein
VIGDWFFAGTQNLMATEIYSFFRMTNREPAAATPSWHGSPYAIFAAGIRGIGQDVTMSKAIGGR